MEKTTNNYPENPLYGTIYFYSDDIIFTQGDQELSRFSIHDIKVIGEMIMGGANRFLVFVDRDNKHYSYTFRSINMMDFQAQLGKKLKIEITPSAFFSDEYDSNVIYPTEIAGKKLFTFVNKESNIILAFINKLRGLIKLDLVLKDEILNYKG